MRVSLHPLACKDFAPEIFTGQYAQPTRFTDAHRRKTPWNGACLLARIPQAALE